MYDMANYYWEPEKKYLRYHNQVFLPLHLVLTCRHMLFQMKHYGYKEGQPH